MAEVLECKAAWRLASQGAWEGGRVELRCSGTQEGGTGSGPSADRVVQVESDQLRKENKKHRSEALSLTGMYSSEAY